MMQKRSTMWFANQVELARCSASVAPKNGGSSRVDVSTSRMVKNNALPEGSETQRVSGPSGAPTYQTLPDWPELKTNSGVSRKRWPSSGCARAYCQKAADHSP